MVSECEAREFFALAGTAEDFGRRTATVGLRCEHDNQRVGRGSQDAGYACILVMRSRPRFRTLHSRLRKSAGSRFSMTIQNPL
jgi:hypothetical protein